MDHARKAERGSALVEAAIVVPCLLLILFWAIALTDVSVLKLKAAEAARFALWETTVFRNPGDIERDVQDRFSDRRSPKSVRLASTGLLLFPRASSLAVGAAVDDSKRVPLAGSLRKPHLSGVIGRFFATVFGWTSGILDDVMEGQGFNVFGEASVRVRISASDAAGSQILRGGNLLGRKRGNDLGRSVSLENFAIESPLRDQNPLQLVFDTWKAWPKPAAYTRTSAPTDVAASPMQTYPAVEEQVSAQVGKIAFLGLANNPLFSALGDVRETILDSGVSRAILGGRLPAIFSTDRMDGPHGGPVTILPVERPDASFVPHLCDNHGGTQRACPVQRLGDLVTDQAKPETVDRNESLGEGGDRTRYTVPFRINTYFWKSGGGVDGDIDDARLADPGKRLREHNEYVRTYHCRGHYFAGSIGPEERDLNRRYRRSCP